MTPQEAKAKKLVNCMNDKIISFENVRLRGEGFEMSKQCALICADECYKEAYKQGNIIAADRQEFWLSVKEAIKKL